MIGGKGNDTYVVSDVNEVGITELANQGTDTIETDQVLGLGSPAFANIENLTYTGSSNWAGITGNALGNVITGGNFGNEIFGGLGQRHDHRRQWRR